MISPSTQHKLSPTKGLFITLPKSGRLTRLKKDGVRICRSFIIPDTTKSTPIPISRIKEENGLVRTILLNEHKQQRENDKTRKKFEGKVGATRREMKRKRKRKAMVMGDIYAKPIQVPTYKRQKTKPNLTNKL